MRLWEDHFRWKMVYSCDPARPGMDYIELLFTSINFHSRMLSLFFMDKYLTVLVSDQEVWDKDQSPWLPYEVLKADLSLSSFEQHEEALLDWVHLCADTSTK